MTRDMRAALTVTVLIFASMWLAAALGTWLTGVPS